MWTYFCILHAGYKNVHVLTCTPRKSGAPPNPPENWTLYSTVTNLKLISGMFKYDMPFDAIDLAISPICFWENLSLPFYRLIIALDDFFA